MRWVLAALSMLAGCVYPEDVLLRAPPIPEDARASALAVHGPAGTTLVATDLSDRSTRKLTFSAEQQDGSELALLYYARSLAELGIPEGEIAVPQSAPAEGRALPFERGDRVRFSGDLSEWTVLDALPDWLSTVRIPGSQCRPLITETYAFGPVGGNFIGLAGDGRRALAVLTAPGNGVGMYFVASATAAHERTVDMPRAFRPRAVAGSGSNLLVAGILRQQNRTEVWRGSPEGAFTKLFEVDRELVGVQLTPGDRFLDSHEVYLMDSLGEVLHFDGSTVETLQMPRFTETPTNARHRLVSDGDGVVVLGPEAAGPTVRLRRGEAPRRLVLPSNETIFSLGSVRGTLAGTTAGDVLILNENTWSLLAPTLLENRVVSAMTFFDGELATGGARGLFGWHRWTEPCLDTIANFSLTEFAAVEGALLAGNAHAGDEDHYLIAIR